MQIRFLIQLKLIIAYGYDRFFVLLLFQTRYLFFVVFYLRKHLQCMMRNYIEEIRRIKIYQLLLLTIQILEDKDTYFRRNTKALIAIRIDLDSMKASLFNSGKR